MTSSVFELFENLTLQTGYGNVRWERNGPHQYEWTGPAGSVILKSVDNDGTLPVSVTIRDENGINLHYWVVAGNETTPQAIEFDNAVIELWAAVTSQNDVIGRMLRDLRDLPPF